MPGPLDCGGDLIGHTFDPASGTLWAAVVTGSGATSVRYLATINVATGAVTDIGTSVAGLDAVAIGAAAAPPVAAVPVPAMSAWVLAATALLILAGASLASRRRRS